MGLSAKEGARRLFKLLYGGDDLEGDDLELEERDVEGKRKERLAMAEQERPVFLRTSLRASSTA